MSYRKLLFLLACIVSLSAAAQYTVHNYLVVEPKNPKALLKELNTPQLLELTKSIVSASGFMAIRMPQERV